MFSINLTSDQIVSICGDNIEVVWACGISRSFKNSEDHKDSIKSSYSEYCKVCANTKSTPVLEATFFAVIHQFSYVMRIQDNAIEHIKMVAKQDRKYAKMVAKAEAFRNSK
jgi:hypothetical protein